MHPGLNIHLTKVHNERRNISNTLSGSNRSGQAQPSFPNSPVINVFDQVESFKRSLTGMKMHVRVLKRVPKGARYSAAIKLTNIMKSCAHENSFDSWEKLFTFSYSCLRTPIRSKNNKQSLTSLVKENIASQQIPSYTPQNKKNDTTSLGKRVEAKLAEFDTKGAIRLLSSDCTLAPRNNDTLDRLKQLHPVQEIPISLENSSTNGVTVTVEGVKKSIDSFNAGSAGGIDGLSPQHFKDLTSKSAGEAGAKLLESIKDIVNLMLEGNVNDEIRPFLFGVSVFQSGYTSNSQITSVGIKLVLFR
uniref:Uncharacterized protein n=1 Tax=Cacopsylla melanoneura TaxID=428564 RepID=A0A8D8VFV8_9HEMI